MDLSIQARIAATDNLIADILTAQLGKLPTPQKPNEEYNLKSTDIAAMRLLRQVLGEIHTRESEDLARNAPQTARPQPARRPTNLSELLALAEKSLLPQTPSPMPPKPAAPPETPEAALPAMAANRQERRAAARKAKKTAKKSLSPALATSGLG